MKKYFFFTLFIYFAQILYGGISYTIYSNGTVRDNSTGLLWTRCSIILGVPKSDPACYGNIDNYSWETAVSVCNDLDFAGRDDWRLPSIKELQSIVVYHDSLTPAINNEVFPGTISHHYWSSTTHKNNNNVAWIIDFMYGSATFHLKDDGGLLRRNYVRCVTGPSK